MVNGMDSDQVQNDIAHTAPLSSLSGRATTDRP